MKIALKQVIKEFRVQLAQGDPLAQKVFKVRRVLKEMMDPLVALVNLGCQVPTDNEESKEIKEILVGMAHQEKKGKKETRVQLELQVQCYNVTRSLSKKTSTAAKL